MSCAPKWLTGSATRRIQEIGYSVRAGAESESHRNISCLLRRRLWLSPGGSDKAGNLRRQNGSGGLTATPAINKDMLLPHKERYGWYRFGLGLM